MPTLLAAALLFATEPLPPSDADPVTNDAPETQRRFSPGTWVPLMAAGGATIAVGWLATSVAWLLNSRISYHYAQNEPTALTLIPIAGPWLSLTRRADFTYANRDEWTRGMVISGIAQAAGV